MVDTAKYSLCHSQLLAEEVPECSEDISAEINDAHFVRLSALFETDVAVVLEVVR